MTMLEKAKAAWGAPLPDWIKALAEACDAAGLRKTAGRIKVSPAIVSLAINNKREELEFIKAKVKATIMATIVGCPVLGIIPKDDCLRQQTMPFHSANPQRVRLFRACRDGCVHFQKSNHKEKPC